MATTTTNYGLTKPSYGDNADIAVINSNMDKIDAKMKEIEDAGGSGASTWGEVAEKPFETIGSGLSVDESGALNATGGGSGSSVSWNQIQTSGNKIAEVTIDGTKKDVYAPTGGSGGGGSFTSEILYTATGTGRSEIELSKPYTDFDYLDITILKFDDNIYYDFMHTFIDCSQQEDIKNNNLFSGRTNTNIIDVWAANNSYLRFKIKDDTHIEYPNVSGADTIFQVKGIKFTSSSGGGVGEVLYHQERMPTNSTTYTITFDKKPSSWVRISSFEQDSNNHNYALFKVGDPFCNFIWSNGAEFSNRKAKLIWAEDMMSVSVEGYDTSGCSNVGTTVPMMLDYYVADGSSGGYGNVYSTEETVVGTWVDGRNIYRKVFVGSSDTYDVTDLNIDAVIMMQAYGTYTGGYKMCINSSSGINSREAYIQNGNLKVNHNSFDIQHIILEYVKVES